MKNLENKEIFSRNLQYYMNKHNIDRNMLCDKLGFKYMTVSDWINSKSYPRIDKIEKLANFFNINKSDLIEDKLSTTTLSKDEQNLLDNYNNSNTTGKTIILDTSKNISKAYPFVSREEMIEYIADMPRAAWGGSKNVYDMTDEELEKKYYQYKKDLEDVD